METTLPCASKPDFLEDVSPSASDTLKIIMMLADRVASRHGANHPHLLEVQSLVASLPDAQRFATIRRLTNGYALPPDACLSFRALYERLADYEAQQ